MHSNSTSSSIYSRQCPTTDDPSALSLLQLLHLVTQLPVVRSKPAYPLPDQPDRTGMRDRRDQNTQKLSELQHSRGVEPPENPHTELLEAYGYRQFAQLMMEIPMLAIWAMHAMSSGMSFRIGPTGADAAPLGGAKSPTGGKNSVEAFEKKFTKDFEIWVSPEAKADADMRGMIIVIGEHHFDPAINAVVKKVMLGFRRTRGDRFFLEGGIDLTCREREGKYLMESGDCRVLEKDCAAFWRLKEFADLTNRKLLECIAYLKKHVPAAQEPITAQNTFAYSEFMKRHAPGLPLPAIPGYEKLKSAAYNADVESAKEAARLRPERDAHMVKGLLEQLTETGLNYLIVGSDHLKDIRELLKSHRCIFMVPRLIVKEEPAASLYAGRREEL